MALFQKILSQSPMMSTSEDSGNTCKLILVAIILFLAMPQSSSRPILAKKCPSTNILDSEFLQEFKDETQLDLSYCGIQLIMPAAFVGMTRLEKLSLVGNNLHILYHGIFYACDALSTVDLSSNQHLDLFPHASFLQSKSIKELVLRSNGIQEISPKILQDLPSLQRLDLSGNPVCEFHECDMKSAETISQWLRTEKGSKTDPDHLMLKNNSYGTFMRNASIPGRIDFTLKPRFYPFLTFMVVFSGFLLCGCAVTVVCKQYDQKPVENEGFRKVINPSDVDLEEVVSDAGGRRVVHQRPCWKKQLHLLYIIMKHYSDCGVQPLKL